MAKRLRGFPANYAKKADKLLIQVQLELRDYMLCMIEVAELDNPDRKHFRKPEEILMLALQGFGRRLYTESKDQLNAHSEVEDLLKDLGIEKGGQGEV